MTTTRPTGPTVDGTPPPARLVLAAVMRWAREQAGMSLEDAAQWLQSRGPRAFTVIDAIAVLSRMERGQVLPKEDLWQSLLRAYGADPRVTAAMPLLADHALSERQCFADCRPQWSARLGIVERQATTLRIYTSWLIPHALRTSAYSRALVNSWPSLSDHGEGRPLLAGLASEAITLIVDWNVLRCPVGNPTVMADQLRHLLHLAALGTLCVRVVPEGSAAICCPNSLLLAEMTLDDTSVLYAVEGPAVTYASGPKGGAALSAQLDEALSDACSESESRDRISAAVTRFEGPSLPGWPWPATSASEQHAQQGAGDVPDDALPP